MAICVPLTHCCALPAEGCTDLHIERSRVANWQAWWVDPYLLPPVEANFSGRCFQSVAGGVPVKASMDRCNAWEAGVSLDNQQMWPRVSGVNRRWEKVNPLVWAPVVSFSAAYRAVPYRIVCQSKFIHLCGFMLISTCHGHYCFLFVPARRYASAGNRHSNVSVRLSVTRRYCVKTKKASGMISSLSGSPKILTPNFITKF